MRRRQIFKLAQDAQEVEKTIEAEKEKDNTLISNELLKADLARKGLCVLCKLDTRLFDEVMGEVEVLKAVNKKSVISDNFINKLNKKEKERAHELNEMMKKLLQEIKIFKTVNYTSQKEKLKVVKKITKKDTLLEKIRKSEDEHISTDEIKDC